MENSTVKSKEILTLIIILLILTGFGFLFFRGANQLSAPQNNTFYIATYQNTPVLFYTFAGMMMPGMDEGSDMGQYIPYEQPYNNHRMQNEVMVSFRKLQNPRTLFSFERYASIENIILNDDKTYLVMSFIGGKKDSTNYIYQVNLKTLESKKIREHEVNSPPYNRGFAYVMQFVPDRYVLFALIKGDPPITARYWAAAGLPEEVIIKNILSGKENMLGIVGDTHIDIQKNTVSYRMTKKINIPCEGNNDPACFAGDTYKNIYAPAGQMITQPLP